jgi:phosphonopyruvate decarboxylase
MTAAAELWDALKAQGLTFFAGVPCSLLTSVIDTALADPEVTYVTAPREDAALGVASGAWLAGRESGILLQNSGLGNVVNGLTSFNMLYKVPVLMIVSWRGFEGKDAPEHLIMGARMLDYLDLLGVPAKVLEEGSLASQVADMAAVMRSARTPVSLIVKPGLFA